MPFSQNLNKPNPFNLHIPAKNIYDRNFKAKGFFELCNIFSAAKRASLAPGILSLRVNSFKSLL